MCDTQVRYNYVGTCAGVRVRMGVYAWACRRNCGVGYSQVIVAIA